VAAGWDQVGGIDDEGMATARATVDRAGQA
jgi:hypothetical protein